jgi:hypothetical protein
MLSFTDPNTLGGIAAPCFRVFLESGIMEEFGCTADPLYCDGKESQGYPCSQADDQNWSHAVLTAETDAVVRVAQNGQGGQQSSVEVDSATSYSYQLSYPLVAQPCSDCAAGMYWATRMMRMPWTITTIISWALSRRV